MKTENDLPGTPEAAVDDGASAGLFTDQPGGGGEPMLPDSYDGAEPSAPSPESIETKSGEKLLRLKLPNGHVYTGKTERELLEQVYKGKVAADEAIRDRENQIRNLQSAPPVARPASAPAPHAPVAPGGEEWDPQRYLNLLGEDPMKARMYQDKFMYGGLDPVQATSYAYNVATRLDQQMLAASFHDRNPDFPISPENSKMLMGVLQSRALQPTIVNLEWAYGELKRNGTLLPAGPGPAGADDQYEDVVFGQNSPPPVAQPPAAAAPRQQPQPPPAGTQRRGGAAPPSPRNGGGNNTPDVMSFEEMTLEQIKDHARKIGALKH